MAGKVGAFMNVVHADSRMNEQENGSRKLANTPWGAGLAQAFQELGPKAQEKALKELERHGRHALAQECAAGTTGTSGASGAGAA